MSRSVFVCAGVLYAGKGCVPTEGNAEGRDAGQGIDFGPVWAASQMAGAGVEAWICFPPSILQDWLGKTGAASAQGHASYSVEAAPTK